MQNLHAMLHSTALFKRLVANGHSCSRLKFNVDRQIAIFERDFYCRVAIADRGCWSSRLCSTAMQQLLFDKLRDQVEYLVQ